MQEVVQKGTKHKGVACRKMNRQGVTFIDKRVFYGITGPIGLYPQQFPKNDFKNRDLCWSHIMWVSLVPREVVDGMAR